MTKKDKQRTSTARATLSVRQSARQAEKKRAREPTEAGPVPSSGKRIRSGTITAQTAMSAGTVEEPGNAESPAPARPRACPKMRVPQPEPESEDSAHSNIELPPNSKFIVMSNIAKPESKPPVFDPAPNKTAPLTEKATENLPKISKELPVVQDSAGLGLDSDVVMLDESTEVELIDSQSGKEAEPVKPTHAIKSEKTVPTVIKDERTPVQQTGNTAAHKDCKAKRQSTSNSQWKVRAEQALRHSIEDEEDTWNRDGDSDEDSLGGKVLSEKRIGDEKMLIEYELRSDTNYYEFCHKIGQIIDSLEKFQIGYWAGKRKDLKGKPTVRVLENVQDYREMVKTVVEAMTSERDRYEKESRALEEAAKEAKGKRGAPSKKKVAPIEDYIVRLVVTPMDDAVSKKGKKSTGSKDKKLASGVGKPVLDEEEETGLRTEASKQLAWLNKLKAKHFCAMHKRHCARLPGEQDMLAQNREDVTIFKAPKALRLHERKSDEVTDSGEAQSDAVAPTTPSQAPTQPTPPPHQYPPPFFPGWPPYYPPPGTPGYPSHPYAMPTLPATTRTQPLNDPLLSEWLVQCDSHATRGADGHQFSTFIPQFNACRITRVSDIARFLSPDQLREAISEHPPKIPYGTAARLLDYAKMDYQ